MLYKFEYIVILIFVFFHLEAHSQILTPFSSHNPSLTGNTGSLFTPSTNHNSDKVFNIGTSFLSENQAFHSNRNQETLYDRISFINIGFLPFLELSILLSHGAEVPGLGDRSAFAKMRILKEKENLPSIAIGFHDFFGVNSLYNSSYIMIGKTKKINQLILESNIGYGTGNISNREDVRGTYLTGIWGNLNATYKFYTIALEYDADQFNTGLKFNYYNRINATIGLIDFQHFTAGLSMSFSL